MLFKYLKTFLKYNNNKYRLKMFLTNSTSFFFFFFSKERKFGKCNNWDRNSFERKKKRLFKAAFKISFSLHFFLFNNSFEWFLFSKVILTMQYASLKTGSISLLHLISKTWYNKIKYKKCFIVFFKCFQTGDFNKWYVAVRH